MNEAWRTLRIFISSTFRDMQAERDHLVRFVFPRLREELLADHIHLIDIDLRWGVTSEQDALQVCKDVIDECRPHFIGLLGGRYGWTPPGRSQSITEEEILYGVLDAKNRPHSFFYCRDEAATQSVSDGERHTFVEAAGSDKANRLRALKRRIYKDGYRLFVYPARWDETSLRFIDLNEFGERVYADLLANIRKELRQSASLGGPEVMPKAAGQDLEFGPFVEDRVARYVPGSRQKTLDQLMAFVSDDSDVPLVVVTGEPGSGKSALLAWFYRDCRRRLRAPLVIGHFVGATAESTDLRWTLKRICSRLAAVVGRSTAIPEETQELIDLFPRLLRQAAAQRRIILLIDAVNQFGSADNAWSMRWLPLKFPANVRVILSALEHPALAAIRSRAANGSSQTSGAREIVLPSLAQEDARAIISRFLSRYGKRLDETQVRALIAKPDGCNPLYLLTALEELRTLGEYHEITDRIARLPGNVGPLFDWVFADRLAHDPAFRDHAGRLVGVGLLRDVVGLLAASRAGLSQGEIITLAAPDDPQGNVGALLRLLRPYLMRRGELLNFYHGQVHESAERVFLAQPPELARAHAKLAHYFAARGYGDPRAVAEIVYHCVRCPDWGAVQKHLGSLEYMEARAKFQQYYDMILQYDEVLMREPPAGILSDLGDISRFVRSQSHILSKIPDATFQQAANQPSGTAPERAARESMALRSEDRAWIRWVNKPPRASERLMTIAMFKPTMTSCAFEPTGKTVLMTYADGSASVWSMATGAELSTHQLGLGTVTASALTGDGRRAAFGGSHGLISIVDLLTGVTLATLRGARVPFTELRFSDDGLTLSSCSGRAATPLSLPSGEARIWDVQSGRTLRRLIGGLVPVLSCRFAPQSRGAWLVLADTTTRRFLSGGPGQVGRVSAFKDAPLRTAGAISSDGTMAAWGTAEGDIIVADVSSGRVARMLKGHGDRVTATVFTHNDSLLVTSSFDSTVRLWDVSSGQCLQDYSVQRNKILSCFVDAEGRQVLSVSNDGIIQSWEISTHPAGSGGGAERSHSDAVTGCDFSPDGRTFATSSLDGSVRVRDARTGASRMTFAGHNGPVQFCKFSGEGEEVVSASRPSDVMIWSVATGRPRLTIRLTPVAGRQAIGFLRRLVDGLVHTWLPGALVGIGIAICSLETEHLLPVAAVGLLIGVPLALSMGRNIKVSVTTFAAYACLALDASLIGDHFFLKSASATDVNAPWAATVTGDAILGILAAGFVVAILDITHGCTQTVKSCDFSTDSQCLAVGTHSGTVSVYDFRNGHRVKDLGDHLITSLAARLSRARYTADLLDSSLALGVNHCAYLADGQIVAVGHDIQTPLTWDVRSGALLSRTAITEGAGAVGASHRNGSVATYGGSERLSLWKAGRAGGRRIAQVAAHGVRACCFAPDGAALLTASSDGWARIYSVPHLELVRQYPVGGVLTAAAWSPNGRDLAVGNEAGSVFLLEMFGMGVTCGT